MKEDKDLRENIRRKGEIPWPPGKWRLGLPCPGKAEYVFLRFATKGKGSNKNMSGLEIS